MNMTRTLLAVVALPVLFAQHVPAAPARPTAEVKATTDRIIAILRDGSLQGDAHKSERRRLMRQALDLRFDWTGIARSSLGRHWSKRSPAEQQEFVKLFSEFLQRTYLDKFEVYYTDLDKIEYQGERIIENYASVKAVVTTREKIDHPVEYRLLQSATVQAWRIYDVIIEGVSLVNNYRAQFDEIIAKSSYEKLIADLQQKLGTEPR
jgi:phospholipid transport system substrate-binding protein